MGFVRTMEADGMSFFQRGIFDDCCAVPFDLLDSIDYFYALMFSSEPCKEMPHFLEASEKAVALRDAMLQGRQVLEMMSAGEYNFSVTARGFLGGLLNAFQANLRHAAWMAQRVADGDLNQRMELLGEFSEAFNRMTERLAETTARLRAEEERWRLALECSRDGVFEIVLNAPESFFCSQRLVEMQRSSLETFPPVSRWDEFIHPEDMKARHILRSILNGTYAKENYDVVFRLRCSDGVYRWRHSRGQVFRDEDGKINRIIGILEDIHDSKEREDDFKHRATHDSLTGLPNKPLFFQCMRQMAASAKRLGKVVLVIAADLDRFKEVNDTLGHHAGDLVLQEFAQRLHSSIRKSDVAARLGGDEFALLLTCEPDSLKHTAAMQRIRAALEPPVELEGTDYQIRASFGIAVYPQDGDDALLLLKRADDALYRAKRLGRSTYCFWTPAEDQQQNVGGASRENFKNPVGVSNGDCNEGEATR